jgi:hypothetical protein
MTLGPLEYVLIGFEGNRFTGQILPELRAAQEKGIIRVIDLLFLMKDVNGAITAMELRDLRKEEVRQYGFFTANLLGVLEPDDVEAAAMNMPNNSAAALMLIEHTWAVHLKEAILNAGGMSLAGGLVAPEVTRALEAELEQAAERAARQGNAVAKTAE